MNNNKSGNLHTGDVVLVSEQHVKRATWKNCNFGVLIAGKDGKIRGAKVRKAGRGKPEFSNCPVQN